MRPITPTKIESLQRPRSAGTSRSPPSRSGTKRSSIGKNRLRRTMKSLSPSCSTISAAHFSGWGNPACDVWRLARIAGKSNIKQSSRYVHPSNDAELNALERWRGHKAARNFGAQNWTQCEKRKSTNENAATTNGVTRNKKIGETVPVNSCAFVSTDSRNLLETAARYGAISIGNCLKLCGTDGCQNRDLIPQVTINHKWTKKVT
jgi:hypothetical protein